MSCTWYSWSSELVQNSRTCLTQVSDYHIHVLTFCIFSTSFSLKLLLCPVFSVVRSSLKVFDSADICGPRYKVRFMKNAKPKLLHSVPLDFFLMFILWYFLLLFSVWWFFIWGLVPKPSKTILMLSCLHITKTISLTTKLNFVQDLLQIWIVCCFCYIYEHLFLNFWPTSWIFIVLWSSKLLFIHISLCVFPF